MVGWSVDVWWAVWFGGFDWLVVVVGGLFGGFVLGCSVDFLLAGWLVWVGGLAA